MHLYVIITPRFSCNARCRLHPSSRCMGRCCRLLPYPTEAAISELDCPIRLRQSYTLFSSPCSLSPISITGKVTFIVWAVLEDPDTRPWDFESFLPETAHAPEIVRYLMGDIFCIWYESGMKMSAEEMAEFGTRLALHGIYSPDN